MTHSQDGKAATKMNSNNPGIILRAANERPLLWVSSWSRMPYSPTRSPGHIDWLSLVCGRRHRQIFRSCILMPPSKIERHDSSLDQPLEPVKGRSLTG